MAAAELMQVQKADYGRDCTMSSSKSQLANDLTADLSIGLPRQLGW